MQALKLGNTEFEGRNNAYLLADDEVTLIDTGVATVEIEQQLRTHLDEFGYEFADVDTIVLTHWHPDHAGLAGTVQQESNATIYLHEDDASLVQQDRSAVAAMRELQIEQFSAWGIPAEKREELLARLDRSDMMAGDPVEVETITSGDVIDVGAMNLRVIHAPGHTAGLCCFEVKSVEESNEASQAFVGDAVLPVYTPNVGGADVRVDQPLGKYLDTLKRIIARDFDRVWPGHRDPIDDPTDRARYIIDHHRERAERVERVLNETGPATAWEVSAQLFGTLEGIHIMHGPGEAYAHLDHRERHGLVGATPEGYDIAVDNKVIIDDMF